MRITHRKRSLPEPEISTPISIDPVFQQSSSLIAKKSHQVTLLTPTPPSATMSTPIDKALNSKNLFISFAALITAATAWYVHTCGPDLPQTSTIPQYNIPENLCLSPTYLPTVVSNNTYPTNLTHITRSVWGQDMFPAASSDSKSESANTTTQPETWSEAELRRWLKKVIITAAAAASSQTKITRVESHGFFFFR